MGSAFDMAKREEFSQSHVPGQHVTMRFFYRGIPSTLHQRTC